jgi:hypothetical protein
MQKESYLKPDVKTEILEPEVLCYSYGSGGGSFTPSPTAFLSFGGGGSGGGITGLGGCGGSMGEGPSVGDGGFGVK